ncbi:MULTISPECIES: CHASE domain-containing protein [Methylomonas]|uniref:histidine kinase n=2 Tax=Methylomonas TaxID=416 RepID=A0A140E4L4_9GAMM|nr:MULTISPECIES: CHASE domain-containing protein [Methylomonas]AMK75338.1 PAS domain S-box protein [Methylomonas denitrificans]OAH99271.1 PAS domain S-box protein [Methylomonas methanica]TCV84915.1 PAS domain S-box-containing protein [Methylomonas methanica]
MNNKNENSVGNPPRPSLAKLKKPRYYSHWLTATVLSITLLSSYQAWQLAVQDLENERRLYFDFRVRQLVQSIEQRLQTYEQMLYGARGLFAASGLVERNEYREYVSALNLDQRFPGIQGVGFSLWIPKTEKDRHVAQMRKQGFADYDIHPVGERDFYSSIIYLEPFSGRNLRAFSYDMFSEPTRNLALSYARDNNSLGVTGKVKLLQETDKDVQAGFLMYLPVYKKDVPHDTLEQRSANLLGWVYAPFRSKDLMAGIGGEQESDLGLEIFNGDEINEENRMYGSPPPVSPPPILTSKQHIVLACHPWTLLIHAEPNFQARVDQDKPLLIAGSCVSLSLLLSLLTWQLVNSRSRAMALAQTMTSELRESENRFRTMADSAPVLIWLSGPNKLCYWFNKVWLDFTGRSIEQETGNGWVEAVHPDDLDFYLAQYIQHFEKRWPFSVEFRLRRHDGEYRWLLDTGIPRYDDNGEFVGYIGSCIDITERRQVRIDLQSSNADLSRFAEISAHHLMEPTRRFSSFTQRLRHSLRAYPDASHNEEINTSLDYLEQDAQRLLSLVRDIQLYVTADQARDKIDHVNAEAAVEAALHALADQIAAAGAIVSVGHLPNAYIDLPRLIELFSLFLDNALRHGRPANPELNLQIEIGGVSELDVNRYYVRDNGAGIDAEYRQRVFEIFERLNYRDHEAGTGIGLSIARRIVTSCRGKIWIDSTGQNGTAVVFELPNIEGNKHDG